MSWADLEHTIEGLVGLVVLVAGIYYSQLLFRGQRVKAATQLAATTIDQQDRTINAQGERIELQDREIVHLKELGVSKDRLIESQGARITYLETVVTARDLIEAQGKMIHAGFTYLQVPDEVLAAAAS